MAEMAKHVRTTIRYDGPALGGHEMDVQDLAPALLALADMIQIANRKFNGDRADIRVLVNADVEQKCFMIDLSLIMSLLDQAKGFFDSDRVKTAREIAEWIGLIGGGTGGVFALLKYIRGREEPPAQMSNDGRTVIIVVGDGTRLEFPVQTLELAQDRNVVDRAKTVLRPLGKPGYSTLAFLEGDAEIVELDEDEASRIIATPSDAVVDTPTESVATISGVVRIKSPQYEGNAKWSLLWNGRAIDAEMIEQAAEWVEAFQHNRVHAPPNTILSVSMTETVRLDDEGKAVGKPHYTVSQIHSVTPPAQQTSLNFDTPVAAPSSSAKLQGGRRRAVYLGDPNDKPTAD